MKEKTFNVQRSTLNVQSSVGVPLAMVGSSKLEVERWTFPSSSFLVPRSAFA